jgi:POT family proton-dependent oligopeptide transporter
MINVGALIGGMVIPVVLKSDQFVAYMIPFSCFAASLLLFVAGSSRYVKMRPQGKINVHFVPASCSALAHCPPSLEASKRSRGGRYEDRFVDNCRTLLSVFPVNLLVLPFAVCYAQIGNGLSSQGMIMQPAGFVDAAWMTNFDCFGVLIGTALVSFLLYPCLARRGITWQLTTRFAIGTAFSVVALAYTIALDYFIRSTFAATGEQVSVLLQAPAYLLIGVGEVFAFSAGYEAAFTIAPKSMKSLASAVNLFIIAAIPQYISTAIINVEAAWFRTPQGITKLDTIDAYCAAKTIYFWWTIFAIAALGIFINVLPPVRRFVDRTTALAGECNAESKTGPANFTAGTATAGRDGPVSVADANDY